MKASDLRIGNLIEYKYPDDGEWALLRVSIEDLEDVEDEESFRPIPLTEECLLKFGFTKHLVGTNDIFWRNDGLKNNIIIDSKITKASSGFYELRKIQYVHQLQNLYFALTGEELTVK